MKVGVGGTFNVLHDGHRALLSKAFELGGTVVVGLASDSLVSRRKSRHVPLAKRKGRLEEFLSSEGGDWEIEVIDSPLGTAVEDPEMEFLVVSPGTKFRAQEINRGRKENGYEPLRVVEVNYVLADDFLPISSTRILSGETDGSGKVLKQLKIGVGSENPVKLSATRKVMARFFDDIKVVSKSGTTTVPDQPWEEETVKGAMERAKFSSVDCDLGIGIEAGVFEKGDGLYDIQYCAIVDGRGVVTTGHGSGFLYPDMIADLVREGMTVSQAFSEVFGKKDIGEKEGAIGFLSKSKLDREALTTQAVMAAMIPRIKQNLYPEKFHL